jgi:hypothetical protein
LRINRATLVSSIAYHVDRRRLRLAQVSQGARALMGARLLRRARALIFTLWFSLTSLSLGQVLVLCEMTGEVGVRCCCHADEMPPGEEHSRAEASKVDETQHLSKPMCCAALLDRSTLPSGVSVFDLTPHSNKAVSPQIPSVHSIALALRLRTAGSLTRSPQGPRAPPDVGSTRLYRRDCRYLI